jgi:mannitol operon transcriptional antiterminator
MGQIKITVRQKEILRRICSEYKYVTISSIAEKLNISSRTVLRELGDIDAWLLGYACSLEKKAGIGIRLKGSLEARKDILEDLEEGKEVKSYSPKERQIMILGELLQNNEPVKLFMFTKMLNVTEGTVSHDLDKVEEWLKDYSLRLVRKPGLGIYIEGQEYEIRKAIANLIYENINEAQLLDLIRENLSTEVNTRERLLNLIEKDTIRKLESLIFEHEEALGYRLTDNAYIGLLVHLALAIQRIKKNEKISMDKTYLKELKGYGEFGIAANLAEKISKVFNIEIPEQETGYITMHLRGSKGFENKKENTVLEGLAKEMLKVAEVETGSFLEYDEQSLTGLINHLGPTINRLKMNMDIRNPLLEEIKEHYSDLFMLAAKCVVPIENYIGIKLPDSEIAYIAMHLGAALERKPSGRKKVFKTVVSCTTGMGTSALLATRIEKEYDNIQVVDIISSLHVKENRLIDKGVDFIISTVPIEAVLLPVVVVNPLLFEKDKEKVEALIKQLKRKPETYEKPEGNTTDLKEKLSRLNIYTEGILQVLNNFFLYNYESFKTMEEVIEEVGSKLSIDKEGALQIQKDLKAREEKGSTVMSSFNSALLHCKTSGIKEIYFGAMRINNGLYSLNGEDEKEQIKLAIVMLAPEHSHKQHIEILSFLSTKLIEAPEFLVSLKEGSEKDVYKKLNNYLEEFYKMNIS